MEELGRDPTEEMAVIANKESKRGCGNFVSLEASRAWDNVSLEEWKIDRFGRNERNLREQYSDSYTTIEAIRLILLIGGYFL